MRNWKSIAAAVIAGATVSAAVYAQQGVKTLTAQDHAEIEQLYSRYNWALDSHADNGMAFAKTFTPDGEFTAGTTKFVGPEQLAGFAKAKPGAPEGPHHLAANIRIQASPGGAEGGAYFFQMTTPTQDKPGTIIVIGTYKDVLAKTAEGWRFKTRTFHFNAMPPSAIAAALSN